MELKVALILTFAGTLIGFIIALTIVSAVWALLLVPHVVFVYWLVQHAFKQEKLAKKLVDKFSSFNIEQRVSYQNKTNSEWQKVHEKIDTLKEADARLDILVKDFQPIADEKNGQPVFVDWRIVQKISGEEIYERNSRELPLTPEAKLQTALDKLNDALNKTND